MLNFFIHKFNPENQASEQYLKEIRTTLNSHIEAVESIDDDRILNSFIEVIEAMVRSNFFCGGNLARQFTLPGI